MAKVNVKARLEPIYTIEMSEVELRALQALAGYNIDAFLETFYEKMGKHCLEPHEKGLRSLFHEIYSNNGASRALARTEDAKDVFHGKKKAV